MKILRIAVALLAGVTLTATAGCGANTDSNADSGSGQNPIVTITMEDGGEIKIELYPDKAPNTVANFVTLIQDGYYDGVVFHRLVPGFVIQGGDPTGTGTGGPGYSIKGEFTSNKFDKNDIAHERGVISMARSQSKDSGGSQFFICVAKASGLDGDYAAFGKVMDEESMKVVDDIVSKPTSREIALNPQAMKTVTVDTFGVEYKVDKLQR